MPWQAIWEHEVTKHNRAKQDVKCYGLSAVWEKETQVTAPVASCTLDPKITLNGRVITSELEAPKGMSPACARDSYRKKRVYGL